MIDVLRPGPIGGQARALVIAVDNSPEVRVGDQVVVGLPEISVIKASLAVYLLPALGLVGGAFTGWRLAVMNGDGATLVGALAGLVAGFGAARFLSTRMARNSKYVPKLIEIVGKTRP